jgi:hypothetical protein
MASFPKVAWVPHSQPRYCLNGKLSLLIIILLYQRVKKRSIKRNPPPVYVVDFYLYQKAGG